MTKSDLQDIEECTELLRKSPTDTIMYGIELIKQEQKNRMNRRFLAESIHSQQ